MKRLAVGLIFAFSLVMLVQATPALAGGQAGFGCSPPFTAVTLPQMLQLSRVRAGIDAGALTQTFWEAFFATINHNGDSVICYQLTTGLENANLAASRGVLQYEYNFVDDNSSA
jgi:hypothetical protein